MFKKINTETFKSGVARRSWLIWCSLNINKKNISDIYSVQSYNDVYRDEKPGNWRQTHLPEHDERLLYPGEDLQGDVRRAALSEGVFVRDDETVEPTPLSNLLQLLGF